jgi:hypothetical protein
MASKLEILEKEQKTKREKFITKKTVRYLGVWCSIGFFLFSLGLGYYSDRAAVLILDHKHCYTFRYEIWNNGTF